GSDGGVGCVVVVPAVERQRSGVGGGVVLEMVTERRGSVAAWVVVLAVGRRTLPEKWRRVTESVIVDRIDRDDPKMPSLETTATYDDSEEEADFTNLKSSIHVSPTPTTRTHNNHPLKQVIGSLNTPV
nr:hypothetical protein [Tanacetum cinerariifolium]